MLFRSLGWWPSMWAFTSQHNRSGSSEQRHPNSALHTGAAASLLSAGALACYARPAPVSAGVRQHLRRAHGMDRPLRLFLGLLGAVLISAPLSIVITILLFPLWSWFEASTGIETVGHSGPAEWCYAVVFLILATGAVLILLSRRRGG